MIFEREARISLFSSATEMTHSCHQHNTLSLYHILTRNNISRAFSLFLGYAMTDTMLEHRYRRRLHVEHSSLRNSSRHDTLREIETRKHTVQDAEQFLEKQTHHKNTSIRCSNRPAAARNLNTSRAKEKLEKDTNSQIKTLSRNFKTRKKTQGVRDS